jgi:tripartite-type tricarboxylate transporter receptor subunit TctC
MMQDLLAGQVDFAFDTMSTSAGQIRAGKLRALAVTTGKRIPLLPDTPTLQEVGVKGFDVSTWYAMWAIRGTPQAIIDRMHAETLKALALPDSKELWASQGAEPGGQSPAEFGKFVNAEIIRWAKVVKDSGAKVDN